jgi:thioredoxin 1
MGMTALPEVPLVDSSTFARDVLASDLPVLVDVTAEWCPPCKAAAPVVAELARRFAGRLKVVAIDGDAAAELVARLGVRGFPTFLGIHKGEVVARQAGFGGKRGLETFASALVSG